MNRPLQHICTRARGSLIAIIGCSVTVAVVTATPALAGTVSPPTPPGSGGSATVTNEGSQPMVHTFGEAPSPGATQVTPDGNAVPAMEVCRAETEFTYGLGSGYVGGKAEGVCTAAKDQELEVCAEQNYSGSWHSSGTCRVSPLTYTTYLKEYSGALQCTPGRYFRIWSWYYTPGGHPEVTTALVPGEGGMRRC